MVTDIALMPGETVEEFLKRYGDAQEQEDDLINPRRPRPAKLRKDGQRRPPRPPSRLDKRAWRE